MLLEPRFTAETFADFLNIPKQRNLLRKHLRLKFIELLNRDQAAQKKSIHQKDIITPLGKYKARKARQLLTSVSNKFERYDETSLDMVTPRRMLLAGSTSKGRNLSNNPNHEVQSNQLAIQNGNQSLKNHQQPIHIDTVSNQVHPPQMSRPTAGSIGSNKDPNNGKNNSHLNEGKSTGTRKNVQDKDNLSQVSTF